MIKVLIVDDEHFPRETIVEIVKNNFSEINICAQATSVQEGIEAIRKHSPDLVLLDIDLPDGTGFDILHHINPIEFKIIFITAHEEYAVKAFKFSALDYVLKPVNSFELIAAIQRATVELKNNHQTIKLDAFFANIENITHDVKKIVLKTAESIHLINVQNIIRCQSDNYYTVFYLNNGQKILISTPLRDYEELLSQYGFFRVHQSHLVNVNCIVRYDKKEGGCIVMVDNSHIPVSQRKRQALMNFFDSLK